MRLRRLQKVDGLGLLEVLVGMIILGIGLLGLAPMIVTSIEANVIARDHSDASELVKEKIEYYESLDPMPAMPYQEHEAGLGDRYSRSVYITDNTVDTLIPDGVYEVRIAVGWIDNNEIARTTTLTTYLLKN